MLLHALRRESLPARPGSFLNISDVSCEPRLLRMGGGAFLVVKNTPIGLSTLTNRQRDQR